MAPKSLLDLPTELRLQIYDMTIDEPINCNVLLRWSNSCCSRPNKNKHDRLNIPWVNLLAICWKIRSELKLHMATKAQTYTADIEAMGRSRLGPMTWRTIHCAPTDIQTVTVNYLASTRGSHRYRGCGGYCDIVSHLYQALNVLLHCGPRMDVHKALDAPMHIKKLVVNVCLSRTLFDSEGSGEIEKEEAEEEELPYSDAELRTQRRVARSIRGFAQDLCDQGMLYGLVDTFEIRHGDHVETLKVHDRGVWVMPKLWKGCGFDWGLEHFRTGKWSSSY